MRRTSKYFAVSIALLSLAAVLLLALRRSRERTARLNVPVARDTCACYTEISRIVVLRVTDKGDVILGPDEVPDGQLVGRLREIYRLRAERVLYLFPENGAPFRRVADVIEVVQHLQLERAQSSPVPKELQAQPENMNIHIRLVTPQAISAPCPDNCFNWAVKGIPVVPGFATPGSSPD